MEGRGWEGEAKTTELVFRRGESRIVIPYPRPPPKIAQLTSVQDFFYMRHGEEEGFLREERKRKREVFFFGGKEQGER